MKEMVRGTKAEITKRVAARIAKQDLVRYHFVQRSSLMVLGNISFR